MKKRYIYIDLLRFICAIWIAYYHLLGGHGWFKTLKHSVPSQIQSHSGDLSWSVMRLGFIGVPIFFVISGFSIVLSSERLTMRSFYIKRISRLLPGFLLSFALTIIFALYGFKEPFSVRPKSILATLSFSWENTSINPIQGSYWTLWVEASFYIIFSLFVLTKDSRNTYFNKVVIFVVVWYFLKVTIQSTSIGLQNIVFIKYGVFFMIGVIIGLLTNKKNVFYLLPLLVVLISNSILDLNSWMKSWDVEYGMDAKVGTAIFILSLIYVVYSLRKNNSESKFEFFIINLGKCSYFFYLIQEGVGLPMVSFMQHHGVSSYNSIHLAIVICFAVSYLFVTKVESNLITTLRSRMESNSFK